MPYEPIVTTTVKTYGAGQIEYGLAYDDHCVVPLMKSKGEWQRMTNGYIPYALAIHVSALALSQEVYSQAIGAALNIMQPHDAPPPDGGFQVSQRPIIDDAA